MDTMHLCTLYYLVWVALGAADTQKEHDTMDAYFNSMCPYVDAALGHEAHMHFGDLMED